MSDVKDFEKKYDELLKASENIKNEKLKLSDALEMYDDAMNKYKECKEILENVKGEIEVRGELDD